jgi:hypothetical protein
MNGYQCGSCGECPCICPKCAREQRIKNGTTVIESLWQAITHLPRWKQKIINWLWPDMLLVAKDLKEHCDRSQ